MKYISALLLAFLLLIPVGLIAVQRPANALEQPAIFVTPPESVFQEPCLAGTTFNVSVDIFNTAMSGVDIYAFSFTLAWSNISSWVELVPNSIVVTPPWASGDYFIVNNATSPPLATGASITNYELAVTATPPGTGLTNIGPVAVVTLTFQITQDVCWPANVLYQCGFSLENVQFSGDGTHVIPISQFEVDCGSFEMYSVQPNIELSDADAATNATYTGTNAQGVVNGVGTTLMLTEKCISHETDVEVSLTNVTGVYGFSFELCFDNLHLEVDLQKVTIKAAFPPPYEYLNIQYVPPTTTPALYPNGSPMLSPLTGLPDVLPVPGSNNINVTVIRPCEKPGVCGADVPAVDIIFHTVDFVQSPVNDPIFGVTTEDPEYTGGLIPTTANSTITLCNAYVLEKCFDPETPTTPDLEGFAYNVAIPTGWIGSWSNGAGTPYPSNEGLIYGVYAGTNPWGLGSSATFADTGNPAPFGGASALPQSGGTLVYSWIVYWWHPSRYDLNLDCTVDIQDLIVLSFAYGVIPAISAYEYDSTLLTYVAAPIITLFYLGYTSVYYPGSTGTYPGPYIDWWIAGYPIYYQGSYADLYSPTNTAYNLAPGGGVGAPFYLASGQVPPIVDIFDFVAIAKHFGPVDP